MTKEKDISKTETLTEQWKNGELKEGWYYLSITPNKKCIDYYYGKDFERYNEWAIEEVLTPVLSYKEYNELLEKFKELADQNESFKLWIPPIQIDPEEVAELVQKNLNEIAEEIKTEDNQKLKEIEQLFWNTLLSNQDGNYKPIKNTSKQQCYNILGKIQEILGSNKFNGIYGKKPENIK